LRVIAVANQKGGCGKTTTSINFAACLAFLNKKILLIDLDPQGHSTCGLGIQAETRPFSLYDFLSPEKTSKPELSEVLCEVSPNLSILPTYGTLSVVEEELAHAPDREKQLKQLIDGPIRKETSFDYVIIDCPPNLGVLTYNAFEAADEVVVPIEPSFFSLHGLAKISETLDQINRKRDCAMRIHALLSIFDSRTRFAKEVFDEVKEHFKDQLFKTIIHESVVLKEAAGAGQHIVQYDPESSAFKDFFNLAVEYLEKDWERQLPSQQLGWQNFIINRFGPKRVIGGILFQFLSENAKSVEIAGDFNNWIPESLLFRPEDSIWKKIVSIQQGSYRYKFIVDGEWQMDPYHNDQIENAHGSFDSYLNMV